MPNMKINAANLRRSLRVRNPGQVARKCVTTLKNKERKLKKHIKLNPNDKGAITALKNL